MKVVRNIAANRLPQEVFDYLADFTNTEEWDPGTVRTTRLSGDGGVGTRYHNVSRFLGRETELVYVVEEHHRPQRLQLRGENKTVVARDSMTITPSVDGGSVVEYRATFDFKGVARLVAPLLWPALRKLGNDAEEQLTTALAREPGTGRQAHGDH